MFVGHLPYDVHERRIDIATLQFTLDDNQTDGKPSIICHQIGDTTSLDWNEWSKTLNGERVRNRGQTPFNSTKSNGYQISPTKMLLDTVSKGCLRQTGMNWVVGLEAWKTIRLRTSLGLTSSSQSASASPEPPRWMAASFTHLFWDIFQKLHRRRRPPLSSDLHHPRYRAPPLLPPLDPSRTLKWRPGQSMEPSRKFFVAAAANWRERIDTITPRTQMSLVVSYRVLLWENCCQPTYRLRSWHYANPSGMWKFLVAELKR